MKDRWNIILILVAIFISDDTLLFGTNANPLFEYIKYACFALSAFFLIINTKRNSKVITDLVLMCSIVLLSSLVNNDLRMGLLYKITLLVFSAFLAQRMRFEEFRESFCKILYILSAVSVVGAVIAIFVPSLLSFGLPVVNKADTIFSTFIVFSAPQYFENFRNYGIFREPGVYQMYLVLALYFELCVNENFSFKRVISYMIALILTFSTTGFIALGITLLLFQISSNRNRISTRNKILFSVFAVCGVLYLSLATNLLSSDGIIFDKFSNTDRHTTIARFSSITSNIEMWKESPLFGLGLENVQEKFIQLSFRDYGFASEHNTNTFLCELATFGIFYFILFFMGIYNFCKYSTKKYTELILLLAVVAVLAAGEKLTFSPFFYILLFYGYNMKYERVQTVQVQ